MQLAASAAAVPAPSAAEPGAAAGSRGGPRARAQGQDWGPGLAGCPLLAGWPHSYSERGQSEVEGMSSAVRLLIHPMGLLGTFRCSCGTSSLALTQVPLSPEEASQPALSPVGVTRVEMQLRCTLMASWRAGGAGGQPDPRLGQPRCPVPVGPARSQADPPVLHPPPRHPAPFAKRG